jgi:NADH:ubiquinone oxidoreductase subunit 3 (subunit A)
MSKNNKTDCVIEPAISEEDAYILGLEGNVKGFKMALTVISIIVFAAILLYIFNPVALQGDVTDIDSTKSKIVYMTISTIVFFVCATLLAKMFIKMKQGSSTSTSASGTTNESNSKTYTIVNLILTVCSLIIILIIAFSDDFKKNTALSMNYFIMFVLIVVSCLIYLFSTKDDYVSFNKLPRPIQMFYSDRAKYSILFVLYIFTLAILYYYDPWNIMTKYMGLTIFFASIVGITIVLMIYLYQFYFTNPSHSAATSESPTFVKFIGTSVYILSAMSISGLLLYGLLSLLGTFNQDSYNKSNLGHTVLNYIMLAGMLAVIWKLANSGGYLAKNPVFKLVLNIILYIPCLLVNVVDYFTGQYNASKQTELKMLLIALSLFVSYFLLKYLIMPLYSKKYYGQGGNSIVNEPLTTEKATLVASYQDLNNGVYVDQSNIGGQDDGSGLETNSVSNFFRQLLNIDSDPKRNYHYALSFWFYLDSFPPSTSSAYNKTSNIVSFGGNPAVRYNAVTNSLVISMKYNDPSCKIATQPRQRMNSNVTSESINTLEGFNQMRNEIRNKIEDVKAMPTQVELDEDGNMIVYVKEGVLLQKWNNVVLNYNGGTLDIFYNGQLVKSAIELVPCITFDSLKVGDDNGVSGNVANLLYFNESIDYIKVNTLYNSLKGMNPPIIPGTGPTMLQRVITSLQ